MPKDWTFEQAKIAMAMKGWLGDQKSALVFKPDPKGNAFIASFPMTGKLDEIHQQLLDDGLAFHTLEPTSNGAMVHVYGEDQATHDTVAKALETHDTQGTITFGQGSFIGTTKTDGSDREQRDDARSAYEAIIRDPQSQSAFAGRDIGKLWDDIRSRWGGSLSPQEVTNASAGGSEDRVSTTVPSAAKQGFDPHQRQDLAPTYDTFKKALENPKYAAGVDKLMDKYGKTFLRMPKDATVAQKAEAFVSHATANLTALYNAQDPGLRGRSATWYRGARKIADDFSKQYGVSPRAVAGVLASLSPQRDWDQNVEMAKRVLDIAVVNGKIPIEGEKAARTKTAMLEYAQQQRDDADKIEAKLPRALIRKTPAVRGQLLQDQGRRDTANIMDGLAQEFEGKKLSDIPNLAERAMVLRFYDEGNAAPDRAYAIWNPEGTPSGEVAMAGKPGKEKGPAIRLGFVLDDRQCAQHSGR